MDLDIHIIQKHHREGYLLCAIRAARGGES
jgi:hypothetical protein